MKKLLHLLAAALLATALPAFSQSKPETPETGSQAATTEKSKSAAAPELKTFTFNGGSLRSFVSAFKNQLGVDLYDLASIDPKALNMQVPKMKIPFNTVQGNAWESVLITYNHLSRSSDLSLGRWNILRAATGPDSNPNAVIFLPPKDLVEEAPLRVKAFSLERLPTEQFEIILRLIDEQSRLLRDASEVLGKPGNFGGELRHHPGTGLLIASGGQEYVELAGTIIEAYREAAANRRIKPE